VAMDCEMVGVGPSGTRSVLARVSIVDHEGNILLDKFVRQNETITDYRTHITGITAATLQGPGVIKEELARKLAAQLMDGKVVVGHALQNDFQALFLSHPHILIRDTALFRPLRPPGREKKTPSLASLCEHWLHQSIHEGKHDSVEDARVALRLYRLRSRPWERQLRSAMAAHFRKGAAAAASSGQADGEEEDEDGEPVGREGGAAAALGRRGAKKLRGQAGPDTSVAAASTSAAGRKAKRRAEVEGASTSTVPSADLPSSPASAANANPSAKKRRRLAAQAKEAAEAAAAAGAPASTFPAPAATSSSPPAAEANPSAKKRRRLAAQAKETAEAAATAAGAGSSPAKPAAAGPPAKKRRRGAA